MGLNWGENEFNAVLIRSADEEAISAGLEAVKRLLAWSENRYGTGAVGRLAYKVVSSLLSAHIIAASAQGFADNRKECDEYLTILNNALSDCLVPFSARNMAST